MVMKGMSLYVIMICISTKVVRLRCKQFFDCFTQNVNK